MTSRNCALLLLIGAVLWTAGTIYYRLRGAAVLETSDLRYWINFLLSPLLGAIVCILVLRALHLPASTWAAAGLLLALPGMVGEAVLLANFPALMPGLQASSGAKYAAFLFAAYALFLGVAESVTLRAAR
jgi:Family of unknown function (DUF5367)